MSCFISNLANTEGLHKRYIKYVLSNITFISLFGIKLVPFFVISTFGGNPLASAVAMASLDVIEEEKLVERYTYFYFLSRLGFFGLTFLGS